MNPRKLRTPEERVGALPNGALPPPEAVPPPTEELLRHALIERDDLALEQVVQGLRPEMLRMASRHVRSVDDAEDVVQDTWIAALSAIDRFEGRASLRTWLLRILANRARTASRHRSRVVPWSDMSPPSGEAWEPSSTLPSLHTPPPDPEADLVGRDLQARIEDAMPQLTARQRWMVRLRDLQGWSPPEVSRVMGVSPGNQRVLLHRARTRLRSLVVT